MLVMMIILMVLICAIFGAFVVFLIKDTMTSIAKKRRKKH